jgi:hypothetical protein
MANAQFWNGTRLIQALENDMQGRVTYDGAMATGYVIAVADLLASVYVCLPDGVSVKQVQQVVFNYMKAHPEIWNNLGTYCVAQALAQTWPCEPKK